MWLIKVKFPAEAAGSSATPVKVPEEVEATEEVVEEELLLTRWFQKKKQLKKK